MTDDTPDSTLEMKMDNDQFRALWFMLDEYAAKVSEGSISGLASLNAGGILNLVSRLRGELDTFSDELVARTKAKIENAKSDESLLRDQIGSDRYDSIMPQHCYGLDFGPKT